MPRARGRKDQAAYSLARTKPGSRRALPVSVLVIDFLHWKYCGDWKLDPQFWPDPQAMVPAGLRERLADPRLGPLDVPPGQQQQGQPGQQPVVIPGQPPVVPGQPPRRPGGEI